MGRGVGLVLFSFTCDQQTVPLVVASVRQTRQSRRTLSLLREGGKGGGGGITSRMHFDEEWGMVNPLIPPQTAWCVYCTAGAISFTIN